MRRHGYAKLGAHMLFKIPPRVNSVSMESMSECRHFLVHGRVQGVFFRASTRHRARELGLTGWVANRADGRVEALACGPAEALDAFGEWLWQGPAEARVTRVEAESAPDRHPPADFSVR